jgi:uncharacterized OsmC-like protein
MKPLPHGYSVRLIGGASGYATLSAAEAPNLLTAPPTEFGGPGDAWSPEHLLLASVQACFLFTFRAVARKMGLAFTSLTIDTTGIVGHHDAVVRFTAIHLRVRIVLPDGVDRETAIVALEKAKKGCLVSASLSTPVSLEADIVADVQLALG